MYKDCYYFGQLDAAANRNGNGIMVYENGRSYEGEWLNNKKHGNGYETF